MINIKIPTKPKESDFSVIDRIDKKENEYKTSDKNTKIKKEKNKFKYYALAYIILFFISCSIVSKINRDFNEGQVIMVSCFVSFLCLLLFNFIFIGSFDNQDKTANIKEESHLLNPYLQSVNKYKNEIAYIKNNYPFIEKCDFDVQKYNDFWINHFENKLKLMISETRKDGIQKLIYHKNILLDNLDLIGYESVREIQMGLYSATQKEHLFLIQYFEVVEEKSLDYFISDLRRFRESSILNKDTKGIIITRRECSKNSWYFDKIKEEGIESIGISALEEVIPRYIKKKGFKISAVVCRTPFNAIIMEYTNVKRYNYYVRDCECVGFNFQFIKEVFTSKKEIFERIKAQPKQPGIYGILKYDNNKCKPIYGLVYFEESYHIYHFMKYFCAAIDNETKDIADIVTGIHRMRYDVGDYWYNYWSSYCSEE